MEELSLPFFVALFENFQLPLNIKVREPILAIDEFATKLLFETTIKCNSAALEHSHRTLNNLSRNIIETELNMIHNWLGNIGVVPKRLVQQIRHK